MSRTLTVSSLPHEGEPAGAVREEEEEVRKENTRLEKKNHTVVYYLKTVIALALCVFRTSVRLCISFVCFCLFISPHVIVSG